MKLLETQAQFEEIWFSKDTSTPLWIIYFTADWCKACKKLNLDAIVAAAKMKNIMIWKCDESVNDYTAGFCGVRSFPTFVAFKPGKIISRQSSSDTDSVIRWIQEFESA